MIHRIELLTAPPCYPFTFLPPNRSSDEIAVGPSTPMTKSSTLGIRSPMLMVIGLLPYLRNPVPRLRYDGGDERRPDDWRRAPTANHDSDTLRNHVFHTLHNNIA